MHHNTTVDNNNDWILRWEIDEQILYDIVWFEKTSIDSGVRNNREI